MDSIRVVSGVVVITYGAAGRTIAGKSVLLLPGITADRAIVWACGHHTFPAGTTPVIIKDLDQYTNEEEKYLPLACRRG